MSRFSLFTIVLLLLSHLSLATAVAGSELCHDAPRSAAAAQLVTGPHLVTLRFIDAATEELIHVRAGLFDDQGNAIAPSPQTLYMFQNVGFRSFFYCDGIITLWLPEGDLTIFASRGFEYEPVDMQVDVSGPDTISVTMNRWIDMRDLGWYSGDTHAHMTHDPVNYMLGENDMMRVARAEELHFMHVMDQEQYFTGAPHVLSEPDRILYFGKEYRNPHFAHMSLLGLLQWISTTDCGVANAACGKNLNSVIAQEIHMQAGAVVIATHPAPTSDFLDVSLWPGGGVARGLPLDLPDGHIDAMDILCYTHLDPPAGLEEYTKILNAGFKVPASAGSDAILSSASSLPPGGIRVYCFDDLDGVSPTSSEWIEDIKEGKTFVTNYPLFEQFDFMGVGPGETIVTAQAQGVGQFTVRSRLPLQTAEVVADGQVMQSFAPAGDPKVISGSFNVDLENTSWLCVRVWGDGGTWHTADENGTFAQTSPVYIEHPSHGTSQAVLDTRRDGANHLLSRIDEMVDWFDLIGYFPGNSRAAFDTAVADAIAYYHALVPDPPEPFALISPSVFSPAHNSIVVVTTTPVFEWEQAVDHDPGDAVTYNLRYGTDPDLIVATVVTGLVTTVYTVPGGMPLSDTETYYWRVDAVDSGGLTTSEESSFIVDITATGIRDAPAIAEWVLESPAPNPFNPSVVIRYRVPEGVGAHRIDVMDVGGRRVRSLFAGEREPGLHMVEWDGRDARGTRVATGVYFVRLDTGAERLTRKVTLVK